MTDFSEEIMQVKRAWSNNSSRRKPCQLRTNSKINFQNEDEISEIFKAKRIHHQQTSAIRNVKEIYVEGK